MKVVLFCGGMGTRLGGEPNYVPKPMVNIGNKPILWHIMKYYAHYGHKEFILCLGYKADVIKNYFINYDYISSDFKILNGGKRLIPKQSDITGWTINFIDTGIKANIGQRLVAVKPYLKNEDMFLANYADTLTDLRLPDMINYFEKSKKIGCLISVKPSHSFHVIYRNREGCIRDIKHISDTEIKINGGYFIFRKEIFKYIKEGEDLVEEPLQRLIRKNQLLGYSYDKFWHCMDTFKEQQELNDIYESGNAPWEIWKKNKDIHREQKNNIVV